MGVCFFVLVRVVGWLLLFFVGIFGGVLFGCGFFSVLYYGGWLIGVRVVCLWWVGVFLFCGVVLMFFVFIVGVWWWGFSVCMAVLCW